MRAERSAGGFAAPDWFGQPRGLTVLAVTEMWEVFSFVGMRALLVYYMTTDLLFSQQRASLIYGSYLGLAYLMPIAGGVICDRWLSRRTAVIGGGLIMALGHFLLLFQPLFFAGLATVAVGAGLYLPALPSQIGRLFAPSDPRRSSAYNIYYLGMNLGSLLAPLVCGTLGEFYGWHWGFGAAGLGMLIGVGLYVAGGRWLPPEPPRRGRPAMSKPRKTRPATARVGSFAWILGVAAIVVVFRGALEQIGNTLAIWLDQGVDRRVGYWGSVPMTWFQSVNPLLVFVLTPVLVRRWTRLASFGREPPALIKMSIGAIVLAAAYALLALAAAGAGQGRTSSIWFVVFVFGMTAAELHVMPVCLELFSRLAPARRQAAAAGVWFATGCGGHVLAGVLGSYWSRFTPAGFFMVMAGLAAGAALLFRILDEPVRAVYVRAQIEQNDDFVDDLEVVR